MNAQPKFGPYRLDDLLGRGGMGEVFRAYDTEHRRTVALKRLAPHLADDAEFQKRFRREAYSVAQLRNPHVVPIHKFGTIDDQLYIDMRYIEGGDLYDLIQSTGGLPPDRAVSMLEQVASALDDAHNNGLVHRDVKPSNVLLDGQITDFCYLADFGITRPTTTQRSHTLTRTGAILGSLAYMAPEQFDGAVTVRSDIYSLTCVFFEMLTGVKPYEGEGLPALMHSHMQIPPPKPSERRPGIELFDDIVANGMAKDANLRYPTAGDLARAALAVLNAQQLGMPRTQRPSDITSLSPIAQPSTAPSAQSAEPPPIGSSEPTTQPGSARVEPGPTGADQAASRITAPELLHPPRRSRRSWAAPLAVAALVLAVLGGGIALARPSATVISGSGSGGATTAVAAPVTTPPAPTSAVPAPSGPVISEGIYTGRTSQNETTVAIGFKNGRAVGYICDGRTSEAWLEGTITAQGISLQNKAGATVVTAKLTQFNALGTVTVNGRSLPFAAAFATNKAGLYQSRRTVKGIATRIGWIVLADGTQVGIRTQGDARIAAPVLDPDTLSAVDDGETIEADTVSGDTTVIIR